MKKMSIVLGLLSCALLTSPMLAKQNCDPDCDDQADYQTRHQRACEDDEDFQETAERAQDQRQKGAGGMKRKAVIECRDVWKIYNEGTRAEVRAIRGINMKVLEKEFVSIEGTSGSGKSTLLHCIGCLDTPTRGKVLFEGRDVSKMNDNELALLRRKRIGFVFQFFNVIPTLTALQNVELPMVFAGIAKDKRTKRAELLLKDVGLGERIDHKPNELSGGETQRVAIARAMANDPAIIMADEPTGNLDSKSGKEIINIFKKLNNEGKTVVVITHDPAVAKLTKKRIKIKDGTIA